MTSLTHSTSRHHRAGRTRPTLFATLSAMIALRSQRRQLRRMDNSQLEDLGLTRAQADRESLRPLWDVPAKWRQ